jgi:hypothetical protein
MPTTGIPLPACRGIGPAGAASGAADETGEEPDDEAEGTGVAYAEPPNSGYNVRVRICPASYANDGTSSENQPPNAIMANEGLQSPRASDFTA